MILSKNDLTGTIPNELSNLASMKSLEVGYNNLSGQVPSEICSLANLNSLEADCYVVQCDCCTICAATPRPTKMPTAPPTTVTLSTSMPTIAVTPSPTVMPTTCNPFINWVPDCIEIGDPLEVSYQNCDPQFGDWIGIYDKDADPSNLEAPYLWVWACGTQDCRDAPQANTVFLDENAVDNTSGVWPLPRGDYLAYLIRNSGGPYAALLLSDTMKLRDGPC